MFVVLSDLCLIFAVIHVCASLERRHIGANPLFSNAPRGALRGKEMVGAAI